VSKVHGHERDPKTGKVKIVDHTPSRGAAKSAGGRNGDFQKDGVMGRLTDAMLKKLKK
jgi:hypothetical protein